MLGAGLHGLALYAGDQLAGGLAAALFADGHVETMTKLQMQDRWTAIYANSISQ